MILQKALMDAIALKKFGHSDDIAFGVTFFAAE